MHLVIQFFLLVVVHSYIYIDPAPIHFPHDIFDDLDDASAITMTFTWKILIPSHLSLTKNILRIFFHFVIIPLMLPALLIFLTYMLTCYSFTHLLICLAEHITTLSSFLLLSKIQYLKNLYVKQSIESFSISLFLASEDLPAHLCSVKAV